MMATLRTPTTSGPRFSGCRLASPPRARRTARHRQTARPAKRAPGSKTAPGIFWRNRPETHPESATQILGTHQENAVFVVTIALGCVVAPDSLAYSQTSSSSLPSKACAIQSVQELYSFYKVAFPTPEKIASCYRDKNGQGRTLASFYLDGAFLSDGAAEALKLGNIRSHLAWDSVGRPGSSLSEKLFVQILSNGNPVLIGYQWDRRVQDPAGHAVCAWYSGGVMSVRMMDTDSRFSIPRTSTCETIDTDTMRCTPAEFLTGRTVTQVIQTWAPPAPEPTLTFRMPSK